MVQRACLWWVVLLAAWAGATGRETVSFDFDWRFHLGDPTPATESTCTNSTFDEDLVHHACNGTSWAPLHSYEDCQKACCGGFYRPDCTLWTFLDKKAWKENVTNGCYLGGADTKCELNPKWTQIKWIGGRRSTPWPAAPGFAFAAAAFDDSAWAACQVPHDFVIEGNYTEAADDRHGYLDRQRPGWYRKHFTVPSDWTSVVWLNFDGVFHVSRLWLNGHEVALGRGARSGYTSFQVRLDSLPSFSRNGANVIALRVDASYGSGHWYEGGGIYRSVTINHAASVHVPVDGISHNVSFPTTAAAGDAGSVSVGTEIANLQASSVTAGAVFKLIDSTGRAVLSGSSPLITLGSGDTGRVVLNLGSPSSLQHWSVQSPALYTLQTSIVLSAAGPNAAATAVDVVNTTIGVRGLDWTNKGFFLNGDHVVLRGFSFHNDFEGIGTAESARVKLYRAQMLRAVGGNIIRFSHNPADPMHLDILDRLGVLAWDENRDVTDFPEQILGAGDLVKRDRNHASVVIWSIGNEVELHVSSVEVAREYRDAIKAQDQTRPVSANMNVQSSYAMEFALDVQGVSHSSMPTPVYEGFANNSYSWAWFHEQHPDQPLVGSESSSCNTQRGETNISLAAGVFDSAFNAPCLSAWPCKAWRENGTTDTAAEFWGGTCVQSWTLPYDMVTGQIDPWVAGTLGSWTLFDYIGEPSSRHRPWGTPSWPQKSSNFGQFDLSGFAKPGAWHYRSWWLCDTEATDAGRPPVVSGGANPCAVVKIVFDWAENQPIPPPFVAVYSNLPEVELFLNGASLGKQAMAWSNWTQWDVPFRPGNLTAVGYDNQGRAAGSDTKVSPNQTPAAVRLSLDAPSPATGTGTALYADGHDTALVRAEVVNAQGELLTNAKDVVAFAVVSGPGRIVGVGNGDPTSHEPNKAMGKSAYHGLVRLVVQVTANTVDTDRQLQMMVAPHARALNTSRPLTTHLPAGVGAVEDIVIEATSGSLSKAQIRIPVSDSASASPYAAAAASVHTNLLLS